MFVQILVAAASLATILLAAGTGVVWVWRIAKRLLDAERAEREKLEVTLNETRFDVAILMSKVADLQRQLIEVANQLLPPGSRSN